LLVQELQVYAREQSTKKIILRSDREIKMLRTTSEYEAHVKEFIRTLYNLGHTRVLELFNHSLDELVLTARAERLDYQKYIVAIHDTAHSDAPITDCTGEVRDICQQMSSAAENRTQNNGTCADGRVRCGVSRLVGRERLA
jgi:hypothetical protein